MPASALHFTALQVDSSPGRILQSRKRANILRIVIAKNNLALKIQKSDICAQSKLFNVHGNTDYAEVGPIKATFGQDMYTYI